MPAAPSAYALEQLEPSEPPPPPGSPQEIVAEARAEADEIRRRARDEGIALGREQGMADAAAATAALNDAIDALHRQSQELADTVEADAVELAVMLAAKIVAGTIEVQPQRVLDAVAGALRRLVERRQVALIVDPDDFDLVSANVDALKAKLGGIEICEVQADRRIGRGGVIVRTVECEVDATVPTQLERAREVVMADLGERQGTT